jgi:hypothetical protein
MTCLPVVHHIPRKLKMVSFQPHQLNQKQTQKIAAECGISVAQFSAAAPAPAPASIRVVIFLVLALTKVK